VAVVEHAGDHVLSRGVGRGVGDARDTVDSQQRPRGAVHQCRVRGAAGSAGHPDQFGRSWSGLSHPTHFFDSCAQ
jgi:hypothetical protein